MNDRRGQLSRRSALAGAGALVVGFRLSASAHAQEGQNTGVKAQPAPPLPGSLKTAPFIDSWIRIDETRITIVTGKVEIGQGIKTALLQVAAEELSVPFGSLILVTADTSHTPNEGYTAGSQSMQDSATAIRHAAAQARAILTGVAAQRWGLRTDQLATEEGAVVAPDGRRSRYQELVAGNVLHVEAQQTSPLKSPGTFTVMGTPVQRVDIPAKLTGAVAYIQDLRLPGMVHARVVRPPSYGARLASVETAPVEKLAGVLRVVRDGSFLAVVAEREYQAVRALDLLTQTSQWTEPALLPAQGIHQWLLEAPRQERVILDRRDGPAGSGRTLEAAYRRPLQLHGSIGPSCAIAAMEGEQLTVWTHSQGVFPLRNSVAGMLGMAPERVRCIHAEGSGCYGHNGADDAAADAAIIARAFPGRPVRVHWMREQEHAFEPFGPAMATRVSASLDSSGTITDWSHEVWSTSHLTRPDAPGNLMPSWYLASPLSQPVPKPLPQPTGGGDRNAIPLYQFPNTRVVHHFVPTMPLRTSALRALGAYTNVFTIESFMDELAAAAGADPVEFRLRHLQDERAKDVIRLAAEKFGWQTGGTRRTGRGRGFSFARYTNLAAYTAIAMEIEVDRGSGRIRPVRGVAANDSGQIVNPDGIRNQIEGAIVQSMSWSLHESVSFDETRVTSRDWSTYPILRFPELPDTIEVHLIDRPGQPFLGTGETAQGPAAASLGNALADATGVRFRELPFTTERVRGLLPA